MSLIFSINRPEDLRSLKPILFSRPGEFLTLPQFEHIMKVLDAFWYRRDDPDAPHVKLSSGKHSNLFLNVAKLLTYPNLADIIAEAMAGMVRQRYTGRIDWVLSSDHSGAAITFALARVLGARAEFFEKSEVKGKKTQVWKRHQIPASETVLFIEELTTTLGTIEQMWEGFHAGNTERPTIVPFIPVIVDRTGLPVLHVHGVPVGGLYTYPEARAWDANECGFCPVSELVEKPRHDWNRLMAHCA